LTAKDNINIAEKNTVEPASDKVKEPSDIFREGIAANVSRSNRKIPHYYLQLDMVLDNTLNCVETSQCRLASQ
jgi:pyruvate dehydrogenase E2 component (dihydrolipoamide acetyltransferase)